jgi:hypothetical protein
VRPGLRGPAGRDRRHQVRPRAAAHTNHV